MKNNKKQIIILAIVLSVLLLIIILGFFQNVDKKIIKIISNNGYKLDVNNLYKKDDAEYPLDKCLNKTDDCVGSALYFNSDSYTLYQSKILKEDGVTFTFTPVYNYKNELLIYTYRIHYKNGVVIFKGEYDENISDYSCNIEYSYGININHDYKDFCSTFKEELSNFHNISKTLFKDGKLLNKMKDK